MSLGENGKRSVPEAQGRLRAVEIEPIEAPNVDLLKSLLTLLEHKLLIGGWTFLVTGLAVVWVLRMAPQFTATAVILPPAPQRANIAAFLSQATPAMGWIGSSDLMRSPSDVYIGLLGSRSVADGIIQDQQLLKHYRAKTLSDARNMLAGATSFAAGKDTLVRISVKDPDPKVSANVANSYIGELYKLTNRFAEAESSQRRKFFETQLENEKRELAAAEAAMRGMQEKTGLVQVNSQVEAMIRSVAQVRAEITSREVMLRGLEAGATDQNPEVIRVRTELDSLREQLRRLESSPASNESSGTILPAGKVPAAGLAYLRALREVRYHESLFEALSRQFEAARMDESKQATVVQVVDYAVPPEFKSGPRRTLLVLLCMFSAAVLACGYVLLRAHVFESGMAPRLQLIWQALWNWR